jgi:hypothetical protein
MKLELKHLSGYLPYGLKVRYIERNETHILDFSNLNSICSYQIHLKPILRPLSDLIKEIEVNGEKFVPINEIAKIHIDWNKDDSNLKVRYSHQRQCNIEIEWNHTSSKELFFSDDLFIMTERVHLNRFWVIQKLLEWHFDIYGLIENGLAVDINTLP